VIFKTVAAAIMDFQKFEILTDNVNRRAKFHQNGPTSCGDMAFYRFFTQSEAQTLQVS